MEVCVSTCSLGWGRAFATESSDMAETVCFCTFSALKHDQHHSRKTARLSAHCVHPGRDSKEHNPPVTALDLPRLLQASLNQPTGSRVDIADMAVRGQRAQDKLDLRPFVRIVLELRMIEERVEHPQVSMAELRSSVHWGHAIL